MDTLALKDSTRSTGILLSDRKGAVAILTLNRPSARNSLSLGLIAALHEAIQREESAKEVAALIIRGAPPAFCAGHDLREMQARRQDGDRGRAFFTETMNACAAVMQAIVACPKPVIAA